MSYEIYPKDLSTRYELSHSLSIQTTVYYNGLGKIQIVCPANDYNIEALKDESIVYDVERGTTFILLDVQCDTDQNRITANGYTTGHILNKRSAAVKTVVSNIEQGVYSAINANLRGLTRLSTAPLKGLTETFKKDDPDTEDVDESAIYGGQLYDEIIPVLDYGELGHKMVWDEEALSLSFEIYKGRDLTEGIHAVNFVEEQGTCSELVINKDSSNYKNVAYAGYRLTDDTEHTVVVGTATGDDRYEVWFDTSVRQEKDESAEDCEKRAKAYATMQLGKYISRQSFDVAIDPTELGTRYDLGDLVNCASNRFGASFKARIKGVKFKNDVRGPKTEIILGDPILTAIGEIKLYG